MSLLIGARSINRTTPQGLDAPRAYAALRPQTIFNERHPLGRYPQVASLPELDSQYLPRGAGYLARIRRVTARMVGGIPQESPTIQPMQRMGYCMYIQW